MPIPDDPRLGNLFVLAGGSLMGALFSVGLARDLAPAAHTPRRQMPVLHWARRLPGRWR